MRHLISVLVLLLASPSWGDVLFKHSTGGVVDAAVSTKDSAGNYVWFFEGMECSAVVVNKKPSVFVQCPDGDNMLMSRLGSKVKVNFKNGTQDTFNKGSMLYGMFESIASHHIKHPI